MNTAPETTSIAVPRPSGMRFHAKRVITWTLMLLTWPLFISSRLAHRWFGNEEVFDFSAKLLSLIPGRLGAFLRLSFYIPTLERCEYDLAMDFGSFFSHPQVRVGPRVVIGAYSIIGTTDLEGDILIASRVSILSGKYQHGSGLKQDAGTSRDQTDLHFDRVHIGRGCWIGEGAVVMASVGQGSVVAAGAVVAKPAPEKVIAAGNPARFIKIGEFSNA